jgi:SSS family solute:Na+ symporter
MQGMYFLGGGMVLLSITGAGIYASSKVKSAEDFSTGGRRANSLLVAGTLMGTMVGGAATIGTAQVAFRFGLSGWWFCLGAGIGFLLLTSQLGRRLYESATETIPQVLAKTYGNQISPIVAVFTSFGIYFSFVANTLAFVALCSSILHTSPMHAAILETLLVLAYVLFGGVWGTGLAGIIKVVFVYAALLYCGVVAYIRVGGVSGLGTAFSFHPWFSLFGRGYGVDLAAGFSMLLGVLSTQTYFQAIASARNFKAAKQGALISAVVTPLVGIGAVVVGLYMRSAFPATPSAEVLPAFALLFLPPMLAGAVVATLLVAVIGCSAGLALGMSTMFTLDIYRQHLRPAASQKELLLVQRASLLAVCLGTLLFVNGSAGSLILDWSFLSMGLRGCTVLFPLLAAMFLPGWVTPKAGCAAAFFGPMTSFVWHVVCPRGIDPLYPGLLASLATLVVVSVLAKSRIVEILWRATHKDAPSAGRP